ncbi:hypothetical protein BJ878DRAFT_564594 [Calycina marina]|uniref:Uncharacterized protein n=1 Tax=Calycina marina TaxID=1763456 RepID=A0A9P7ZAF6_9HELO|nr:hypothetical protein BJ878DRAFT_564594 [Calycina marina]
MSASVTKLPMLLLVCTGKRAGSLVQSSTYHGSQQALSYKNFILTGLLRSDSQGIELVLQVKFRYEMWKRASDTQEDGSYRYKIHHLYKDTMNRGRCPIVHFLGLAFADDIFEGIESETDLRHLDVPATNTSKDLGFYIEPARENLLVFRKCLNNGDVSISSNQYAQLLGHSAKTMGAYYILSISGVDSQAAKGYEPESRSANAASSPKSDQWPTS